MAEEGASSSTVPTRRSQRTSRQLHNGGQAASSLAAPAQLRAATETPPVSGSRRRLCCGVPGEDPSPLAARQMPRPRPPPSPLTSLAAAAVRAAELRYNRQPDRRDRPTLPKCRQRRQRLLSAAAGWAGPVAMALDTPHALAGHLLLLFRYARTHTHTHTPCRSYGNYLLGRSRLVALAAGAWHALLRRPGTRHSMVGMRSTRRILHACIRLQ